MYFFGSRSFVFQSLVVTTSKLSRWRPPHPHHSHPRFIVFKDVFPFYILLSPTCSGGSLSSASVFGFLTPFSPGCVQSPRTVCLQTCVCSSICMCECACLWQRVCVSACLPRPPVEVTLQGVWEGSEGLLEFTRRVKKIRKMRTIYI